MLGNNRAGGQQQQGARGQPQQQYDEPPMDFDDDIPFQNEFRHYKMLSYVAA